MIDVQGALEVSHRKLWMLAGPIIRFHISLPLVGAANVAAAAHASMARQSRPVAGLVFFMLIRALSLLFYFRGIGSAIRNREAAAT